MREVRLRQKGASILIQLDIKGWQNFAVLQDVNADTMTARHFSF